MIEISKEQWNLIENAYKGEWQDYYNEHPEWLGRKVVMWVVPEGTTLDRLVRPSLTR